MRSSNHKARSRQTPPPRSWIFRLPRMPPLFNIIRACVYLAVVLWSVICLAIAAHFQAVLVISDLTRFVPFAIFVCSAGLVIIILLLAFGFRKQKNPISTRIELGCLGLAGTFWLALGTFLATSASESADVECFSSQSSTVPVDNPSFTTETYHAQYRVLEAFSLFNIILILGFLLLLLFLTLREHFKGETQVWYCPVTVYPWLNSYAKPSAKLPAPVTSRRRGRSRSRGHVEKEDLRRPSQRSHRYDVDRVGRSAHKAPAKAGRTDRYRSPTQIKDKFARDASPRR